MAVATIALPRTLNSMRAVDASGLNSLELESASDIVLDASGCTFAEPFPLLYLGFRIKELQDKHPYARWELKKSGANFNGYADHIGFFDFIGLGGLRFRAIGEARGSSNYVPLNVWPLDKLKDEAASDPIGTLLDAKATDLASVLLQSDSGEVFEVVQYAIRELARNAAEHSNGARMAVLAQYWPAKLEAQISIIDDGIGIAENIYDNEFVEVSNNLAAIKAALLPGITGVSREVRLNQDGRWGNSGFGLYVVSRLAGKFGRFSILSTTDYLELNHRRQYTCAYPLRGTLVGVHLDVSQLRGARDFIKRTISEGERMQSEILRDFPIKASVASKMLLSDFRTKM